MIDLTGILSASLVGHLVLLGVTSTFEGAFFTLPRAERERIRAGFGPTYRRLQAWLEDPEPLLGALQSLTTLLVVLFTLSLCLLLELEYWTLALGLVLGPPVVVVVGLLGPRALGARYPGAAARVLALPLQLLLSLLWPLLAPLQVISRELMRLFGRPLPERRQLQEVQLKALVDLGRQEGTLREQERELIHNVFELGDLSAAALMTPRTEMVSFSLDSSLNEVLEALESLRFARLPIHRGTPDNVVGILYTRDLLRWRLEEPAEGWAAPLSTVQALLRPPFYVPGTKRADELFREFQSRHQHVAIVVDEYGGVEGMVTLDDLLAHLFGRTLDEHDVEAPELVELEEQHFEVDPAMSIDVLFERLELEPPEVEEVTTVGGWVVALNGTLPEQGTQVQAGVLRFTVLAREGTRLKRLHLEVLEAVSSPADAEGDG